MGSQRILNIRTVWINTKFKAFNLQTNWEVLRRTHPDQTGQQWSGRSEWDAVRKTDWSESRRIQWQKLASESSSIDLSMCNKDPRETQILSFFCELYFHLLYLELLNGASALLRMNGFTLERFNVYLNQNRGAGPRTWREDYELKTTNCVRFLIKNKFMIQDAIFRIDN